MSSGSEQTFDVIFWLSPEVQYLQHYKFLKYRETARYPSLPWDTLFGTNPKPGSVDS